MLYLVCRADQVPARVEYSVGPIPFGGSKEYYPRMVWADNPEEAVEYAFSPEEYKPAGRRELLVIELGGAYQFEARPIRDYQLTQVNQTRLL